MKQHISTKQLNELSEKGRERLREYWKPYGIGSPTWTRWWKRHPDFPLPSIGEMIGFLDERGFLNFQYQLSNNNDHWSLTTWIEGEPFVDYTGKTLVDALWEAVKEVLEK